VQLQAGGVELAEIRGPELFSRLGEAVLKRAIVPVLCGSAFRNKGVQPLLDAIVDYLPSPLDVPPVVGHRPDEIEAAVERKPDDNEPFSALAFKLMSDPHVGHLTYIRVYSGHLKAGDQVLNANRSRKERAGRLLQMHANKRVELDEIFTGDIVAVVGLKAISTGETLCHPHHPIVLESLEFPETVISIAIEPKTTADMDRLSQSLGRLAQEDPSFRVSVDEETGQTLIAGMGELHLEIIIDRLLREFKVDANVGQPQVAYRETITRSYEIDYTHKKQTGGSGQFARVKFVLEPLEPGEGFQFENKIVGGSVPKEYIPGVQKGLDSSRETGVLAGFPLIDFKASLVDGASHDVDSSSLAFEIATRAAMREGVAKAGPALLEPIMRVEVVTPEEYLGDIMGDLQSRRGLPQGVEVRGNAQVITAMVPLANMFGYVNTLRSMSQGRAQYSMFFDHYEQVPKSVADEVVSKLA